MLRSTLYYLLGVVFVHNASHCKNPVVWEILMSHNRNVADCVLTVVPLRSFSFLISFIVSLGVFHLSRFNILLVAQGLTIEQQFLSHHVVVFINKLVLRDLHGFLLLWLIATQTHWHKYNFCRPWLFICMYYTFSDSLAKTYKFEWNPCILHMHIYSSIFFSSQLHNDTYYL